jgi:glucose/arabinose dehydrogenase
MNKSVLLISLSLATLLLQPLAHASDSFTTTTLAKGFVHPWAQEFLPNGDILVTERGGKIRVVRDGAILPHNVSKVPEVYFAGQGGLLDILLDADFSNNKLIYLSYAYGSANANATRLISATIKSDGDRYQLENVKNIFTASPLKQAPQHYSGRIAQMADGTLLLTVGDGFDYREQAQKLDNHLGKIVRINRDGSAPSDNPFVSTPGAKPEIWSYGHRNHQSLVIVDGIVYQNEHGPKGGDEVNIIKPGLNYGWPAITYGRDYNGAQITPYTEYAGMQQPRVDWTPSIAPSSMTFHKGALYSAALAEQSIRKLTINGDQISDQGRVFSTIENRIRDISIGLDDKIYVLTDGEQAELIKITPTPEL